MALNYAVIGQTKYKSKSNDRYTRGVQNDCTVLTKSDNLAYYVYLVEANV